jgi:hypothetical protein
MKRLSNLNWRNLLAELLVVFVGLFAALQLDDWRQQREFHDAETRYLIRLQEDLQGFLDFSGNILPFLEENFEAVQHVNESLAAGRILDGDDGKFEAGLIYVDHLPALQIHRAAYDEMVASGMFARLRSEQLKRDVAALYATQGVVEKNFSWWRNSVERLSARLWTRVLLYSDAQIEKSGPLYADSPGRRVEFDFDELRDDAAIRNGFYWATDTHSDWVNWTTRLTRQAETAIATLEEELAGR